ncbi:MAG: tRNA glutamyl-Q(34) synthetase GluQRS [Pseudomonadales bacterium]
MSPVGRFAPSPTGPLHMGSLFTALGSYLSAKSRGGLWLLRFDDLDTPRNVAGATDAILDTLLAHGLQPDAPAYYQSRNLAAYQEALDVLRGAGALFSCTCSRKDLDGQRIYPGTCRDHSTPRPNDTWRYRAGKIVITFDDAVQGRQRHDLAVTTGDFVVRRREGYFAYHLACAVDDANGITEVVRGVDLLDATPAQVALMLALGKPPPTYAHLPLMTNRDGQKLSKQSHAPAVASDRAADNLRRCLPLLGIRLPPAAIGWPVSHLLAHARENFAIGQVPAYLPPASGD